MSFPVPINDSENHASQLLNLQDYLLVSKDKQFLYHTFRENNGTMSENRETHSLLSKT